jgi:hypothetical protein
MTLETAKMIVLELGEYANKEAKAVVRGGMTICEQAADGRRTYLWIKVFPTETDGESSIEQALEVRQAKKTASNNKKLYRKYPVVTPVKASVTVPVPVPKEESSVKNNPLSIYSLISKGKQKLRELMKLLDEIVEE